jgi:hypothetical protein
VKQKNNSLSFVHLEVEEFDELLVDFNGDLSMIITRINKISLFLIFNFLWIIVKRKEVKKMYKIHNNSQTSTSQL